mmetsp:Transcript_16982/g.35050  ORF Transcript_16982/g.35050 Transcript_16982/m.35050 type:complete len:201 (+) Transcript_16982:466-1068(+)
MLGVLGANGTSAVPPDLAHQKGPNSHRSGNSQILDRVVQKQNRLWRFGAFDNAQSRRKGLLRVLGGQIAGLDINDIHKQIFDSQCFEAPLGMVSDTRCKNVFGNRRIDAQKHRSEFVIFGQVFRDRNLVDIPQIGVDFILVVLHQPLCQQSLEGRPVMFVELVGLSRWQILFRNAPVFDFGRELGRQLPAIKIQAVITVK